MGREEKHKVRAKRHTPEQVIRKLGEAEVMLGEGKTIPEVAKALWPDPRDSVRPL
jgi:hypothetical protein